MYSSVLTNALINDLREVGLLKLSINYNIPGRLFSMKNNPDIIDDLVRELESMYHVDGHAAEWIVKTWAKSMGMYVPPYHPPYQTHDPEPMKQSQTLTDYPSEYSGQEMSGQGIFQQPAPNNTLNYQSDAGNPEQNDRYQRTNQQEHMPNPRTHRHDKPISKNKYFLILGVILVLGVSIWMIFGFFVTNQVSSDYKKEVGYSNKIIEEDVSHWNYLACSGGGYLAVDAATILYNDVISAEKRINAISKPDNPLKAKYSESLSLIKEGAETHSNMAELLSNPYVFGISRDAGQMILHGTLGIIEVESTWNSDAWPPEFQEWKP
ncbi:hypothetical protein ACKUB1_10405 [Methanospirillum stamsii]|uniref:Uncharacterized protein n=1 Tax=Methanospirillum stamsii TaxID=1277351 RepID=A0A2V2N4C3_9EURY|nr:hypothetical protein [Methanospirillum stamsii]PWR70341.1 hypothetical protein DLD82_16190 [Methanospirillum stamsii]